MDERTNKRKERSEIPTWEEKDRHWNTNEKHVNSNIERETWKNSRRIWCLLKGHAEVPGGWVICGCGRGLCGDGRGSQRAVSRLVFGQNVLTAAEFLPQVGHFLSERRVLFLQESCADGDLVLFQPASVPGPFGRDIVLSAPCPVLVILLGYGETNKSEKNNYSHNSVWNFSWWHKNYTLSFFKNMNKSKWISNKLYNSFFFNFLNKFTQ